MKYSIIIPTYNHCDDLLKPCLDSIYQNTIIDENIEIIVVANGCTDNTKEYLSNANRTGLKTIWFDKPLGYTKAINEGLRSVNPESKYIILLNNDIVLLDQTKNKWITMMQNTMVFGGDKVGITGPMKSHNHETNRDFLIFFCVMIRHSVLKEIGLLDEVFSPGSGEDIDFCIRLQNAGYQIKETGDTLFESDKSLGVGSFPIYHKGEQTVHDESLVQDWLGIFKRNMEILKIKYPPININNYGFIKDDLPDGWFSSLDIQVYSDLLSSLPMNSNVAEIGVWKGRSLCSVAQIIKDRRLHVWAIDTFDGTDTTPEEKETLAVEAGQTDIKAIFEKNINSFGLTPYITIIKGSSFDTHALFKNGFFDLIFLDADHTYDAVTKDIINWNPKIKRGGTFSGHDISWKSVESAVIKNFGNDFNYVIGANIWWVPQQ